MEICAKRMEIRGRIDPVESCAKRMEICAKRMEICAKRMEILWVF
jgi:hypothetical protein